MVWSGTRRQSGTTQRANWAAASPEPVLDDYAAWQRGAGGESGGGGRLISWRGFRAPLCSRVMSAGAGSRSILSAFCSSPKPKPSTGCCFSLFSFFFPPERLDTMHAAERLKAAG